jgi:hypothetical protein
MYKTNTSHLEEVDYQDEFRYVGDFEVDGVLYNRWEK